MTINTPKEALKWLLDNASHEQGCRFYIDGPREIPKRRDFEKFCDQQPVDWRIDCACNVSKVRELLDGCVVVPELLARQIPGYEASDES